MRSQTPSNVFLKQSKRCESQPLKEKLQQ